MLLQRQQQAKLQRSLAGANNDILSDRHRLLSEIRSRQLSSNRGSLRDSARPPTPPRTRSGGSRRSLLSGVGNSSRSMSRQQIQAGTSHTNATGGSGNSSSASSSSNRSKRSPQQPRPVPSRGDGLERDASFSLSRKDVFGTETDELSAFDDSFPSSFGWKPSQSDPNGGMLLTVTAEEGRPGEGVDEGDGDDDANDEHQESFADLVTWKRCL